MKNIIKSKIVLVIALATMMLMLTVQVSSVVASDLSISMTGTSTIPVGSTVTYTITVMNMGSSLYTGVVVTDTIPASMSYVSSTPVTTILPKVVTWNLGTLQPGSAIQITLVLRGAIFGSYPTNTVSVTTAEGASAQASVTTHVWIY